MPLPASVVKSQLEAVLSDLHVSAIKIGIIPNLEVAEVIVEVLRRRSIPVIYDPVMVSTSGTRLMSDDCIEYVRENLFPLCTLITPNLPEWEVIGLQARDSILNIQYSILCKGGHAEGNVMTDTLYMPGGEKHTFSSPRIESNNLHGTGCTLSSAIATFIAKGESLPSAVEKAKQVINMGIEGGKNLSIGKGNGPLWLFKHHILLCLLCIFFSCFSSQEAVAESLKERYTTEKPLVFEDAWEKWPYSFVSSKGEPDGFDIELTREVMRRLGLPFVVRLNEQDSVYSDMESRHADLTFATKVELYAKYGKFGNVTVTQAETSLMVPRKDSVSHLSLDDLCLMKITVRKGSVSHYALVDYGMPDSLITAHNHMAMYILDMVSNGEGGALWNTVMLNWLMRKYDIKDYVLVPTDIPSAEYRYMSNDAQLLHAIDSVCLVMQQEGRIDVMKDHWMYPEQEPQNYLYLYVLLTLLGVGVILTAIVLLMRYYRIYYSHNTLDDINSQMELILSSNDIKVWVYDIVEDTYAWMTPDGKVEREYSAFEFSHFYSEKDFQTIHNEVRKLKKQPRVIVTKRLQHADVSMQAINDDYGKVYMVCGVEKQLSGAASAHAQGNNDAQADSLHDARGQEMNMLLRQLRALAEEVLKKSRTLRMMIVMLLLSVMSVAHTYAAPLGIRYTKKHPLVIVCDWNFAPYSFCNDNSQKDGFLVELVEQVFNQIHVPYEIRMVEWKKAKRMLYSGEAQLMIDITKPDDLYGVKYGKSVLAEYPICVARLKKTPAIGSVELLGENDTIHVNYGDYALHYIVTKTSKPVILPCAPYDALTDLLSGKIKYYVWSKTALRKQVKDFNLQDKIVLDDIDILSGKFRFMSNDAQLLNEIDAQFVRLQTLGRYKPLVDKWLSEDGKYEEGATVTDIIAIVSMLLLFVGSIIALVFIMRGGNTGNLKREFKAVANMAIRLTGCNVLAINVRRMWVYNVSGDFLPRKGLSMAAYEALIHPDDIMTEYDVRQRVDNGERNMPVVSFRMRKHDGAPDEWHHVSVHAYVKSNREKHPAYVYLALRVDEDSAIVPSQSSDALSQGSVVASQQSGKASSNTEEQDFAKLLENVVREIDNRL